MRSPVPPVLLALSLSCTSGRPPSDRPDSTPAASDTSAPAGAPAASATALEGTDWRLIEVGGQPVPAAQDSARQPGLRLVPDGHRVQGSAGCNRMMGSYRLDGTSLKLGPLATTRMACPTMEAEQAYVAALAATVRWEVTGSTLLLSGPSGPVARFEAAARPR